MSTETKIEEACEALRIAMLRLYEDSSSDDNYANACNESLMVDGIIEQLYRPDAYRE